MKYMHWGRSNFAVPYDPALAFVCYCLLSSCAADSMPVIVSQSRLAEITDSVAVLDTQSWVRAPGALTIYERRNGPVDEQRITLPNDTSLRGENFLMLVSRRNLAGGAARFGLEKFVSGANGAPYPFAGIKTGDLTTRDDSLGSYAWTHMEMGGGVVCVLGVRTMHSADRPMPRGGDALDVMLRNCVHGDIEAALAPLGADRIGQSPTASPNTTSTEPLMLSPLAGPMRLLEPAQ